MNSVEERAHIAYALLRNQTRSIVENVAILTTERHKNIQSTLFQRHQHMEVAHTHKTLFNYRMKVLDILLEYDEVFYWLDSQYVYFHYTQLF